MSEEEHVNNPLWAVLIETVHTITMYPHHKHYTQSVFLNDKPNASPRDLALNLGISLGEAMVIFYELNLEKKEKE